MRLWLDADHCPVEVREIVSRAAVKNEIEAHFVANRGIILPTSPFLKSVDAGGGPQAADRYLAKHASVGDLVITADIPLASKLVSSGMVVIHPKGDVFTAENVSQRLSLRNFFAALRESGVNTHDSSPFRKKVKQIFADAFDRELQRAIRRANRFTDRSDNRFTDRSDNRFTDRSDNRFTDRSDNRCADRRDTGCSGEDAGR